MAEDTKNQLREYAYMATITLASTDIRALPIEQRKGGGSPPLKLKDH